MRGDLQQAVEEVLAVERQADAVVDRARAEARAIQTKSEEEASRLRQQLLSQAKREGEALVATAGEEAEMEREHRLAEADRQISELEKTAERRIEAAVRFAISKLLGEVPPEEPPGLETRARPEP